MFSEKFKAFEQDVTGLYSENTSYVTISRLSKVEHYESYAGAALENIQWGGGGVSGLELPSKICELKCYKPKVLNLFSNYKPNVFQM